MYVENTYSQIMYPGTPELIGSEEDFWVWETDSCSYKNIVDGGLRPYKDNADLIHLILPHYENYKLKGYYGEYFIDLIIYCRLNNYSIIELSFTERARDSGASKTSPGFSFRYLILLFKYLLCLIKNFIKKEKLNQIIETIGIKSKTESSIQSSLQFIAKEDENAIIFICGSLYLCGEVLNLN